MADYKDVVYQKLQELIDFKSPCIVAVCGPADVGKSQFCQYFCNQLNISGVSADILTLDGYLMSRSERLANALSGYEQDAYDLRSAKHDTERYRKGLAIAKRRYCHESGYAEITKVEIYPGQILFLDGLHAMHPCFHESLDHSIFIHCSNELLRQIRHKADLSKRKQSRAKSLKYIDREMQRFQNNVAPYLQQADWVIELKKPWQYELQTSGFI